MPDIHHRIPIAASADAVIDLVADGPGLTRWWAEDVTSDADRQVSLGFFDRTTVYRLRRLQQNRDVVRWRCESGDEWHDTELHFSVVPEGEGVVLEFTTRNGAPRPRTSPPAPGAS